MFGIIDYGLFVLSGILLNITPGVDTFYIIGRSISGGRKAGILSALGVGSGCLIHTILAAFGLSLILTQSVLVFNIVKYAGAIYLIYLGGRIVFGKSETFSVIVSSEVHPAKIYAQGVVTNVCNPKVALFFLSFLPQFTHTGHGYGPLPFLFLGLTFVLTGTLWGLVLAFFAATARDKLIKSSRIIMALQKSTGFLFCGLGLSLLRARP